MGVMALKVDALEVTSSSEALQREFERLLRRYALSSQESYLKIWREWCNFVEPNCANALDAAQFIDNYSRTPITQVNSASRGLIPSKASVIKKVMVLHSIYRQLGVLLGWGRNPFEALKHDYNRIKVKQRRPTKMIPFERVLDLVDAPLGIGPIGLRDSAFFALLVGCGLRISEACNLNLCDLDYNGKVFAIWLRDTKNGDDILQPVPNWAVERLKNYLPLRAAGSGDSPLFTDFHRNISSSGRRATRSTMYKRFKMWAKHIGLPSSVAPHAARATVITKLFSDGMDSKDVQQFARHANRETTELYDKRRRELVEHPGLTVKFKKNVLHNKKKLGKG